MKNYLICGAALFALLASPAVAQQYPATARNTNGQTNVVTPSAAICAGGVPCPAGTSSSPTNVAVITQASTSTAQTGTVTSSAITPSTGSGSFSAGTATIGPLTPQLGHPVQVVWTGTWTGTVFVGTSTNNCTTVTPLTVAGGPWASYTANANESVDTPTVSGPVYCAKATIASGTLTYKVTQ